MVIKMLVNVIHNAWLDFLLTAHPLCPDYPKWILKKRSINTGRWY